MSQAELGSPYFTRAMVSAVELGKISPALKSLAHFADKLGVPLSDLVHLPSSSSPRGVALMREHESRCEQETSSDQPQLAQALRDMADCAIETAQALNGLNDLSESEQAVLAQLLAGARSARVLVGLLLTGHYENAMAVSRQVIEDGVACSYLAEHPEQAAKWISGGIEPQYGDMAAAVIAAHAQRGEAVAPGDREAWLKAGEVLREARKVLDLHSHANPARLVFIRTPRGYLLYPFYEREAVRYAAYFALIGLLQILFFGRQRVEHHRRSMPICNTEELRGRAVAVFDDLHKEVEVS